MFENKPQDCIVTFSKKLFNPVEPKALEVSIIDIAHALSLICRGNGHFEHFFSVGQHCIFCAREALARGWGERVALACLLHDASEAYLSDITRPVKKRLPDYKKYEKKLQDIIWEALGAANLTEQELDKVWEIDDAFLEYEFEQLMNIKISDKPYYLVSKPELSYKPHKEIEQEFLDLYNELFNKI